MLRLQTSHKSSCYLPSAAIKLQFNLNKKGFFIAKKQMKILTSQLRNKHLTYEKWEDTYSYCLGRCSLTDKISVLETVRDTKGTWWHNKREILAILCNNSCTSFVIIHAQIPPAWNWDLRHWVALQFQLEHGRIFRSFLRKTLFCSRWHQCHTDRFLLWYDLHVLKLK